MTADPDNCPSRGRLIATSAIWMAIAAAILLGMTVYLSPPDSVYYFAIPKSLVMDGDQDFLDEILDFGFPENQFYVTDRNLVANDWPIGSGLIWTPFYAAGRLVALAAPDGSVRPHPRGAGPWEKAITALGAVALGLGGIALTWLTVRDIFGRRAAWWAVGTAVAGGPLLFYLMIFPLMSHVTSFAALALFVWGWQRTRGERDLAQWILLGLLVGWLGAIRPQNVVCCALFLAEGVAVLRRAPRERCVAWMRGLAVAALASVLAFAPQMLLWWRLYGNPLQLPKIEEMHWLTPRIFDLLFSDYHGLLVWTPIWALVFLGLVPLIRHDRVLGSGVVMVIALHLYLNAANEVWWAGGSFSNRRFVDVTVFAALGLGPLCATRRRAWLFAPVAVVFTLWSLLLLWAERAGLVSLDRYVPFTNMRLSAIELLRHPATHGGALLGDFGGLAFPARIAAMAIVALPLLGAWLLLHHTGLRRIDHARWALCAVLGQVIIALLMAGALGRTHRDAWPTDLAPPPRHNATLWNSHYEYGFCCLIKSDLDEAERAFNRAVELWPGYPQPHRYLGEIAWLRGDRGIAVGHMRRAVEVDPNYQTARQRLGWMILEMQKP